MVSDRHGNLELASQRLGLLGQDEEVMVARDTRHQPRPAFQTEPGDRDVAATGLGILCDDHACRDVRPGLALEPGRHRQQAADVDLAGVHDRLNRRVADHRRGNRMRQGVEAMRVECRALDSQSPRKSLPRCQKVSDHRHRARAYPLEQHGRPALAQGQDGAQLEARIDLPLDAIELARRV